MTSLTVGKLAVVAIEISILKVAAGEINGSAHTVDTTIRLAARDPVRRQWSSRGF